MSQNLLAQSIMEKQCARIINEYRKSRGLTALTLDTGLTHAARFHLQYEALYDTVAHIQSKPFKGMSLTDPGLRIKYFTKNNNPTYGNEITTGGSRYIDSIFIPRVRLEDYIQNLENKVIQNFKSSPKHNDAMLSTKPTKMGICIYTDKIAEGKGVKIRYFCVITFLAD